MEKYDIKKILTDPTKRLEMIDNAAMKEKASRERMINRLRNSRMRRLKGQ
jgi:hypothetical protein